MPIDAADSSPLGDFLEGLTAFVDDVAEDRADGWARVERMRVTLPVEFYVRADAHGAGCVAALESRPADRTLTTFRPVLHGLSVVVEVDGAGQREPGVEP